MTSETRYMRSDTHTINGLLAYQLKTTRTASMLSVTVEDVDLPCYWGIRVWKRTSAGVETEITNGTPVAQVNRSGAGSGIQSATWACPQTTLVSTDAIVVRVYIQQYSTWIVVANFITEQLGAGQLDSATWTVYYHTRILYDPVNDYYIAYYYWGSSSYDSRIVNFTWSTPPVLKEVTDSMGMTDTRYVNKNPLLKTDSLGITDTLFAHKGLSIPDSLGMSDALLCNKVFLMQDSLSINDIVLTDKILTMLDQIGLTDTILADKTLTLYDALGLTDIGSVDKLLVISDVSSITDSVLTNKVLVLIDGLGITENITVIPLVVGIPPYLLPIISARMKAIALIKRNGKVIAYCSPYTPFKIPRKLRTVG